MTDFPKRVQWRGEPHSTGKQQIARLANVAQTATFCRLARGVAPPGPPAYFVSGEPKMENSKTVILQLRVTAEEAARCKKRALNEKVSLSEFFRRAAEGKPEIRLPGYDRLKENCIKIIRIGNFQTRISNTQGKNILGILHLQGKMYGMQNIQEEYQQAKGKYKKMEKQGKATQKEIYEIEKQFADLKNLLSELSNTPNRPAKKVQKKLTAQNPSGEKRASKEKNLHLRVTSKDANRYRKMATKKGISLSEFFRRAVQRRAVILLPDLISGVNEYNLLGVIGEGSAQVTLEKKMSETGIAIKKLLAMSTPIPKYVDITIQRTENEYKALEESREKLHQKISLVVKFLEDLRKEVKEDGNTENSR